MPCTTALRPRADLRGLSRHRLPMLWLLMALALTALLSASCSGSGSPAVADQDTGGGGAGADGLVSGDTMANGDTTGTPDAGGDGSGQCEGTAPAGHATLRFTVDDRARRTFRDGEMIWTGSFALDEAKNVITYTTSWNPTDGPFPLLFDDGPRAACGHEPPEATAGDHVFSTEVYVEPDVAEETTFEYGLLNEFGNWMWVGRNGRVVVPAGDTGVHVADGMVIPPCGEADLEITLDLHDLGGGFDATVTPADGETPASRDVYIKGSMNMWTNVRLVDNGKRGDATAGDGVYTFVLSENLGKHDCHLLAGDHPQFVFSFTLPEQPAEEGIEYKDGDSVALAVGVAARVDPAGDGTWQTADVFTELASDGVRMNTTVEVPGSAPTCEGDGDCDGGKPHCIVGYCVPCFEDAHCGDDVCTKNRCEAGTTTPDCTGDGECEDGVCVAGACVECRDASTCPTDWTCEGNRCVEPAAPDCVGDDECDGGFCVGGRCVECRDDDDCQPDERCRGDRCILGGATGDGPVLYQITPAAGPSAGGTAVTLKGLDFADGLTVQFGGVPAADVVVASPQSVTCVTPSHAIGRVDVIVQNPDGGRDTFFGGFYFYEASAGPQITAVIPDRGPTTGGSPVTIQGANFADGVQVRFGGAIAQATRVGADLLQATAPPASEGPADVTVTNPDTLSATCADCYTYVELQLEGTPTVDGAIGADWPENHLVAENALPSNWGENVLEKLYVAFDETNLYIGVVGNVGADNALIAYLDIDGDPATGIPGASGCWDDASWADLDDALCVTSGDGGEQNAGEGAGSLWFGNASFGADWAFGTRGMASYDDPAYPECAFAGDATAAGWREFADPADLAWRCGRVASGAGAVEAAIALSALYPDGVPTGGSDVGLVVRIVNGEGNYISNQSLPSLMGSSNVYVVTGVVRFRID